MITINYQLSLVSLSRCQRDERNEHFLHRDATMLEGILVVGYVIVVIVRIGEEGITVGEYIRSAQVGRR